MTTSNKLQANTAYPAVSKDTLLSISKKTITSFPGLPSLLEVASEIFSKEPIQPENYLKFNSITDASDVFLTSYGATIRQMKPVQKKRYIIPKSPFSASGYASNGNEKVWHYIDEEERTQGPFSSSDMDSWFDGGYFFNELLIRFKDQGEFRKLSEMLGKAEYQQQQQQNYSNDANPRGFGIARNNSGSNQQQGRNFESKEKFERRAEDKPAAQGGMFARAKKEDVPLALSPTEAPKQNSEEKIETKAAEKPQEKAPEPKEEAPVVQKEEIQQAQPEKEVEAPVEEEAQEEEPEAVEVKKQAAPVNVDDSEWFSIKKTKNKKKGKGNAPEPVRVEPPKPVKAQTVTPQKPVEQEKSPKKEEQAKVEPPKAKEEEKTVEPKPVETQAKVEPPKPLGVSYPFNQNIAPVVGGAKPKKGKSKIIANWADEDAEEVTVQRELERPTEDRLSSVVDFPSLGGSIVPEKKGPVKAGSKNKATKEDQELKQDLLSIQQQQQREEEERKHQMRIKQEEERERKLKQKKEEQVAEAKPVKKEIPPVTEDDFPSLGMGAKVQEKPAPKKKPQPQAAPVKKEEKPVAAPKQKASPVKASNNPKYTDDFPAL